MIMPLGVYVYKEGLGDVRIMAVKLRWRTDIPAVFTTSKI